MNELIENPYLSKIILTAIPIAFKIIFNDVTDLKGAIKFINKIVVYVLPLLAIIWLNADANVPESKFTNTIITFNMLILLHNFIQDKIIENYKIVAHSSKVGKKKVKEINQINQVQAEKMNGIVTNQNYLLKEVSKINDRFIQHLENLK